MKPDEKLLPPLQEILVRHRLVAADDVAIALEMSINEGISLGQVLLNLENIDTQTLARAIALQHELPFVLISNKFIDSSLSEKISNGYAEKHHLVPISRDATSATIAVSRPLTDDELHYLGELLHLRIMQVVAPADEIVVAQSKLYHPSGGEKSLSVSELIASGEMEEREPDHESEAKKATEKDSLIIQLVNKIISDAHARGASDIHIEPYPAKEDIEVRFRIDGCCEIYQKLPYRYKYALPSRIKIMANLDISEHRKPQDGKINFKRFSSIDLELRIATMPTAGGLEDVVIRLLNSGEPISIDMLGLTERNHTLLDKALNKPFGLILAAGPTGSGKTTTLHAGIARINTPKVKIWTAEDPVEITQKRLRQVQVQPKIGFTFATALRSFLRLDPDVIMIGEMRDIETASIAIEASLTGHLVLSTLHTNSAAETVSRLLEMGLDPYSFSDSILLILAQRLARRLCSQCREMYSPDTRELDEFITEYGSTAFESSGLIREGIRLPRVVGCAACFNSGYRGRIGLHELLSGSDAMKHLIKQRAETHLIRSQAIADGMTTLKQDGMLKMFQGMTDIHEVRRVCVD